jgi:hypothetical protein
LPDLPKPSFPVPALPNQADLYRISIPLEVEISNG